MICEQLSTSEAGKTDRRGNKKDSQTLAAAEAGTGRDLFLPLLLLLLLLAALTHVALVSTESLDAHSRIT